MLRFSIFEIIFHKLVSAIAAKINASAAHTFPVIFRLKTIESQSTVSSMLTPRANGEYTAEGNIPYKI